MNSARQSPFVSVIIPVLDDHARLETCLRALDAQTYPGDSYEIVVVDNGSSESVEPVVSAFGRASAVHEGRPGSYAARNRGVAAARGDVLAFTDSDCIPDAGWIAAGVAALSSAADRGLVAGRVDIFFEDPRHPTAVELYESVMAFPQEWYVEVKRYGVTANLFTLRSIFEDVGPFDAGLISNGDYEWGRRVFSSGYSQAYADDARVAHPARRTLRELRRKISRVAGGYRETKRKGARPAEPGRLLSRLLSPFRDVFRILTDGRLRGAGDRAKALGVLLLVRSLRVWERRRAKSGGGARG